MPYFCCHGGVAVTTVSMTIAGNTGSYASEAEALAAVVERIVQAIAPVSVYLFGSRARGDHRPDADFDLLVVTQESDGEAGFDYDRVYAPVLGTGVGCDIIPCREDDFLRESGSPTGLVSQVLRVGVKLYDRKGR